MWVKESQIINIFYLLIKLFILFADRAFSQTVTLVVYNLSDLRAVCKKLVSKLNFKEELSSICNIAVETENDKIVPSKL